MNRFPFPIALTAALLLSHACASAPQGEVGPGGETPGIQVEGPIIEVLNIEYDAVELQILIRPVLGGVEEVLGTVRPGATVVFAFDGPQGQYTLRAIGDRSRRSAAFFIRENSHVRWDLQTGFVTDRRRRD